MADILMDEGLVGETASVDNSPDGDDERDVGAAPVAPEHASTPRPRRHGLFGVAKGSRVQPHSM